MAAKADIEAGRAHILVYLKNSDLMKGLSNLKTQMQGLGSGIMRVGGTLSALGGSIVAPFAGAVLHFSKVGSELADMSARTGESVGSLAELKFAAEQTGAGLEDIEKAIKKQQQNGSLLTFDQMAAKIAAIKDPALRTAEAIKNWGKSGTMLLPLIDNLQNLRAEARSLGLVPTEEAVGMADAIGDSLDKIKSVISATIFEVGAALAPVLLPALATVKNIAGWFNRWAKENGGVIRTVAMIGAGLLVAGGVITAIGATIFGLGSAFGLVATAITGVGAVLGFLLNPITLVVAAVTAGIYVWARFTESGRAAVQGLIDFFAPLLETAVTTVRGIADALIAGDLELAAQIAWQGVLVVFETFKLQVMRGWFALRELMISTWGEVTLAVQTGLAFIAKLFTGLLDQLVPGWQSAMAGITAATTAAWDNFKSAANAAIAGVKIALDSLISKLKTVISGLQLAVKGAQAAAPGALGAAGAGGNAVFKEFTGLDVNKLFSEAADEAQKQNAAGRQERDANQAERAAGDGKALSEQEKRIAEKQAELQKLAGQAAKERQAALARDLPQAPRLGAGLPDVAAAKASFVTFSAAALAAQGGSGPQDKMVRELREQKAIQRNQLKEQEKTRQKLDALQILATA